MGGARADHWGRAAEAEVADWYARRGGDVVARRARVGGGELDLVVRLETTLVFVEVKARRRVAAALDAVRPAQRRRWAAAAEAFLAEGAGAFDDLDMRFDVAAVDRSGGLEVVTDAMRPGWDEGAWA